MAVEAGLYDKLTTVPAITDLVATRIYPNEAPRGSEYPYLTYTRISTNRYWTLGGHAGLTENRFQLSVVSDQYEQVKEVGEALRVALNGERGTWAGVVVQKAEVEDQADDFDTPKAAEDHLIHQERFDLRIVWEEAAS